MAKSKIPDKYQRWIDARKRYHLSHAHIQMARELGLNPRNFGGPDNTKQESWKLPLPEYIEELYIKRFKKTDLIMCTPSSKWCGITARKIRSEKCGDQGKKRQGNRVRE